MNTMRRPIVETNLPPGYGVKTYLRCAYSTIGHLGVGQAAATRAGEAYSSVANFLARRGAA